MNVTDDRTLLRFEHLVEVDGARPDIALVGAARLWQGLKLRIEFPQNFQPALDHCELLQHSDSELQRTLHFGQQIVRDRVRIDSARQSIEIEVIDPAGTMQARLSMQIEHAAGGLWVRFRYAVHSPDHSADSPLRGYVQDAWRQADEETVFRIRQLAATGVLDGTN